MKRHREVLAFLLTFETSVTGFIILVHLLHQIITMADSGLDVNSCFFSEDQSEDNIECSTHTNPVFDLTKRKVCSTKAIGSGRPLKVGSCPTQYLRV